MCPLLFEFYTLVLEFFFSGFKQLKFIISSLIVISLDSISAKLSSASFFFSSDIYGSIWINASPIIREHLPNKYFQRKGLSNCICIATILLVTLLTVFMNPTKSFVLSSNGFF